MSNSLHRRKNDDISNRGPKDMLGRTGIVSLAEAQEILRSSLPSIVCGEEEVGLEDGLGRITSRDLYSPEDLPPHPRSTMDGYAVRAADTFGATESMPVYLEISGEVRMGECPVSGPSATTCFAIATGGLLPPGADAVLMLEHTIQIDERMIEATRAVAAGENVIAAGEDVKKGTLIVPGGRRLRPQDLGLLAGLGITSLFVRQKVRVGIISTGDEIVSFEESPPAGKIRDINSINLAALVREAGGEPTRYGIVTDDEARLKKVAETALLANDVVLLSGSSSVGTRDLGERVIEALGPPGIVIHGVTIKPGKPVIAAMAGNKPIFGLPGHPVSAAMTFDLFVRPTIKYLAGCEQTPLPEQRTMRARLMRNLNSTAGRRDFVRVEIRPSPDDALAEAHPVLGKSGALSTMVRAHGYIIINEQQQGLPEGEIVEVQLY